MEAVDKAPPAAGSAEASRTAARLSRQVEVALARLDMTLPQYRALALLAEGSAAATALARRLAVSRPSVTALVDGLVARGMIDRCGDPCDRRRVTHLLTDAGRRALAEADQAVAARLVAIARHLDPEEAEVAWAGLGAWQRALDAWRDAKVADAAAGNEGTEGAEAAERATR